MSNNPSNEKTLRAALERIARWHGEFPPTGRTWDDGSPMSYAACFGSNGERDYMRQIARVALEQTQFPAETEAEPGLQVYGALLDQDGWICSMHI